MNSTRLSYRFIMTSSEQLNSMVINDINNKYVILSKEFKGDLIIETCIEHQGRYFVIKHTLHMYLWGLLVF